MTNPPWKGRLRALVPSLLALSLVTSFAPGRVEAESLPAAAPWPPEEQAAVAREVSKLASPPAYTNRLILSASPYLRSHADNPVDWLPYSASAFEEARRLDRPVFVSLGYASCHWCEVMERESYSDPEVAIALNRSFVSVKVDREAQPQVAEAYARIVSAMGEPVGWPLHVFLLPDGTPFYGATYLPRLDRPGRAGILAVLASVGKAFETSRESLARRGAGLRAEVRRQLVIVAPVDSAAPGGSLLRVFEKEGQARLDPEWGGRRFLPKRSADAAIPALLRIARRNGAGGSTRELVLRGLRAQAASPVRSSSGGFYEGASDRRWTRVRPEQRLGDNANLAITYIEAWQASGDEGFSAVAEDALEFMIDELGAPAGAFFASRTVKEEEFQPSPSVVDTQILAAENGLAISALSRVGFALSNELFIRRAERAARFVLGEMCPDGNLRHAYGAGRLGGRAALPDYVWMIGGLLDLFEASAHVHWLSAALRLQRDQDRLFGDEAGGYWITEQAPGPGLTQPKHARDGALPAANAAAASNLLRLHALTAEQEFLDRCDALLAFFRDELRADPFGHASLAAALDARLDGLHEVVLSVPVGGDAEPMLRPLRRRFIPHRVLVRIDAEAKVQGQGDTVSSIARLAKGKRPLGGATTAYVCRRQVCASPARTPDELEAQLLRFTPL